MKKLMLSVFFALSFFVLTAQAVTVYYQPTPYPKWKTNGDAMPQDLNIVHVWDGWFNSYYPSIQPLQRDDKLQIGGYGDIYASVLRFDLTGLPQNVTSAVWWLYAIPSGAANPSQVSIFSISSAWDVSTMGWNNFPSVSAGYAWNISPLTSVNMFRGYDLTTWYNQWKNGTKPDLGMLIYPYNNNGTQQFDRFVSSRSVNDGQRPILALTFTPPAGMPNFKMPLPGNASWLLTTEIGGYDCLGGSHWPDAAHQGDNYFAIDIAPTNAKDAGGSYSGDIPVLAAAGGVVLSSPINALNGNYVVIDHDYDGNSDTGYQTRYLHLKDNSIVVSPTNTVAQGDKLGVMGGSGGYSVHLHFGVQYQSHGLSTTTPLSYVVMDGWLMKSFQTECSVNTSGVPTTWKRYYHSSNRVY